MNMKTHEFDHSDGAKTFTFSVGKPDSADYLKIEVGGAYATPESQGAVIRFLAEVTCAVEGGDPDDREDNLREHLLDDQHPGSADGIHW